MAWDRIPENEVIEQAIRGLKVAGMEAMVVENGVEAKAKVLELLPAGAEVMNMTSVTLDKTGIANEIMESGRYRSVKKELMSMSRETQGRQMQRLGAAPEWTVGSVHAVTQSGQVMIASNTGSQLPAYAYGSGHVIWVVGAQKIVKNLDEAFKRLYEHTLPLENERAKKAYGMGSNVSKVLIVNKELIPGRIKMILVKEVLGF